MPTRRIDPAPGQESVWDYPRPPALEDVEARLCVVFGSETLADTTNAKRVLETSHPPVYYLPPEDVRMEQLKKEAQTTFCEWKGRAHYYAVEAGGRRAERAAWAYADPSPRFAALQDYVAFYPGKMDACWVGDEQVEAQKGGFYGGWVTSKIVGPFKGGAGTAGW